jgi:DNA-binding transcriptional MerR regulator
MEEKKLFSIGEVAKLYHISVGNLRHYETIGLLQPEYINPDSGYRYYSVRQFECLNTIRYLRALDMPLDQIKSFLTNRDTDNLQEILLQHKAVVEKKQRELDLIARKVESRIEKLQDALNTDVDKISIQIIPERRFAILKTSIVPDSYLSLEGSLRELDANSSSVFLGKVGLGLTRESLCARRFSPYEFVFLLLDEADHYDGSITPVAAEKCAVIRFRGGHQSSAAYYHKLIDYIDQHHCQVSGFSKEVTLIDYGFTNDVNRFVTEIQIPFVD